MADQTPSVRLKNAQVSSVLGFGTVVMHQLMAENSWRHGR